MLDLNDSLALKYQNEALIDRIIDTRRRNDDGGRGGMGSKIPPLHHSYELRSHNQLHQGLLSDAFRNPFDLAEDEDDLIFEMEV